MREPEEIRGQIREVDHCINILEGRKQVLIDRLEVAGRREAGLTKEAEGGEDVVLERIGEMSGGEPVSITKLVHSLVEDGHEVDDVTEAIDSLAAKGLVYKPTPDLVARI